MSPTFRSLRNRNYRLYYAGGVVSNVGTWMQRIAQDWLVLQLADNDGVALGITTGLQFLPMLLLGPWGGMLADRYSKRKLLILTQAFMGLVAHRPRRARPDRRRRRCGTSSCSPRCSGSAPRSTTRPGSRSWSRWSGRDDLPNAVGLNSASFNLGRVIGPALAGLLIEVFGTGPVFLINGVSFLAVIVALTADAHRRARRRRHARAAGRARCSRASGTSAGRPDLVMVMAMVFFVGTFGMNFQITTALMATEVFGKGAGEFGLLGSIMAIGSLTGALLAASRGRPRLRLLARRRRRLRRRRDRGRADADVRHVRRRAHPASA